MNLVKKIAVATLMFVLLLGVTALSKEEVSAKTMSKVSKVITLTKKNYLAGQRLSIRSNEKVFVKVKILEVKGKVTESEREKELYFGGYICDEGMGSFWMPFPKNAFKKGNTIKAGSVDNYVTGNAGVDWEMPKGITHLKMKITYYTKSGKAGIHSVKTTYNKSET